MDKCDYKSMYKGIEAVSLYSQVMDSIYFDCAELESSLPPTRTTVNK